MTFLCLDLGHRAGWALRSADGIITSGTAEFRQDRWQGGGIKFLRFKTWLTEIKNCAGGVDLVVYEAVRRHAESMPHMHSADGSPSSPPGASITALLTRAFRSARSSGTSPARATPTSRR